MATIADLLARLDQDATTLGPVAPHADPDAHIAGWMLLAQRTRRAASQLPLGGRAEQVGIGLETVLRPLAGGPRQGLPADTRPVAELANLALTMGAIADVLADTLRTRPRPEYVGREATKLEASLLAPVHLAAHWSRAGLDNQNVPRNRLSIRGLLGDLAAVTEPWALIPPAHRGSVLEDFRIRTPSAPGLEGAVVAWADEALLVLHERGRVSGWAMQAIAGNLALISRTARAAVQQAVLDGRLSPDHGRASTEALAESERDWRASAAWPPYVRLGGKVTDLRIVTREVQHHLTSEPLRALADTRTLLRLALPVGQGHIDTMDSLVRRHELWVHGPSLGASAADIVGWAREPWWSHQGVPLTNAARDAYQALGQASVALAVGPGRTAPRSAPPGWPPAAGQMPRAPRRRAGISGDHPAPPGPAR